MHAQGCLPSSLRSIWAGGTCWLGLYEAVPRPLPGFSPCCGCIRGLGEAALLWGLRGSGHCPSPSGDQAVEWGRVHPAVWGSLCHVSEAATGGCRVSHGTVVTGACRPGAGRSSHHLPVDWPSRLLGHSFGVLGFPARWSVERLSRVTRDPIITEPRCFVLYFNSLPPALVLRAVAPGRPVSTLCRNPPVWHMEPPSLGPGRWCSSSVLKSG